LDDFVTPEPVRLSLIGGQFIDIKKRLNHGETEDMYTRMSPHGGVLNRRELRTAKILAYLLGWSLTNHGVPVPMAPELPEQTRIDTIRSLDPDRAVELYRAIEAHEEAMDRARAAESEKKTDETISPSPSAAAGPSATSAPLTSTTTPA
jgi:hypothetical protein